MRWWTPAASACVLFAAACRTESHPPAVAGDGPADLVLRGGAVYTLDAARSWATSVAVRRGRIIYVGNGGPPATLIGPSTEVVDLAGRMVLPGFQDAHVHPVESGLELGECLVFDAGTAGAAVEAVRAYAATHPDLKWIRGSGWQYPLFRDANPSKELLDQAVPDRPVFLYSYDGHSAWVNSRALALAGVTRETPDPPTGRIERDPRSREPTGTLRESAMDLVAKLLPDYTDAERSAALARAQDSANTFGITTVFAAHEGEGDMKAYHDADVADKLTVRVVAALSVDEDTGAVLLSRLREWRTRFASARVHPIAVKLFADGVIESRTAALLEPYLGRHGDAGTPSYDQPTLDRLVGQLDREGFQIHVHAIGDRAIRMTLDAFEKASKENGARDARHSIAHLQLIDPADIPRFRRLGVVANFEALWANGDEYLTKLADPALGPRRSRWEYPIASVVRTGAVVSGGSDWSVSSLNPLEAIEMGITHVDPERPGMAAWNPAERVDLPTMIALYTINAAYANRLERETGSIEVGKLADLVILDHNLFEVPTDRIHTVKVVRTLLEGKTVYRAPS